MRPEPWHLLVLLLVVLIIFGAKRLPDVARSVGKSMRIMKTEVKSLRDDDSDEPSPSPGSTGTSSPAEPPRPLEGRAVDEAREHQREADQQHRPSS
ncbi:Sec-independent protein translocase subunit TatA [Pseudokineococcus sp. 1T1Z-3]|uniref:Sec-independent protein translocase subunit TatA n=1 Tax=Pseudokineococcus sp. 1T1Z-3 TaxID=3132745 RepID=UPI00309AA1CF